MSPRLSLAAELKNLALIIPGAILLACGVALFLQPANLVTGGTPGLAMIIHYLGSVSTGTAMLLINIPLLLAGIKFVDLHFALRSILAIVLCSILIDLFGNSIEFPGIETLLLSTVYGGACVGAGVGLVLKGNASAGGTTILARIISHHSHIKPARLILILDMLIVVMIVIIFRNIELALWSMLSIFITAQLIDKVLTGVISEKIVHITSQKFDEIGIEITQQMGTDGSILSGHNLTAQSEKSILFVLVPARQIPRLKQLVLGVDKNALMIVMEASEISGAANRSIRGAI